MSPVPGGTDPGELRISDLDRENAVRLLGTAMEQGRILPVEYSDRCEQVWAARTRAQLLEVLADLPGGPPPELSTLVLNVAFGQVRRSGRWPVPELVQIVGTGQRTTLDFTESALDRAEVVIEVSAAMSATTVLLPPNAVVDTDGLELVAGSIRHRGAPRGSRRTRRPLDPREQSWWDASHSDHDRGGRLRGWRAGRAGRAEPEPGPPAIRFVLRGRATLCSVTIWHARPARRRG